MSTAFEFYLAMTGWELAKCTEPPQNMAWMACHFSPYAQGLSNIPASLPENSLLMLNDRTEPHCHDPVLIAQQLCDAAQSLRIRGIILDFQRPFNQDTAQIAAEIAKSLPCPVAVTPAYAKELSGPVFLPPIPPDTLISEYLKPWQNRDIWLEAEKAGICLTVTGKGCDVHTLSEPPEEIDFSDKTLCCHYRIQVYPDRAAFSLYRTEEDQNALFSQVEDLGVTLAVGLYQEYT